MTMREKKGKSTNAPKNRELQIMRIVRHPNIVQLKAFYYSNGERVRTNFTSNAVCVPY